METYISDLDIFTENRNLKDIIFVSNCCGRYLKHLKNGIPVKDFNGNKKDYSLVALTRYLQSYVRVKDVRDKIQADFKTGEI